MNQTILEALSETNGTKSNFKKWVRRYQFAPSEKLTNWERAGQGNYENSPENGKYLESCFMKLGDIACQDHLLKTVRKRRNHCGKFDCSSCFLATAFKRSDWIDYKIHAFKVQALRQAKINIGNIIHAILLPNKRVSSLYLLNYEGFLKLRRKIEKLLMEAGMYAGYTFFHKDSLKCVECGYGYSQCECVCEQCKESFKDCTCNELHYEWRYNPHFHAIGYGYIEDYQRFRENHPKFLIITRERRKRALYTAYYILSHISLWRDSPLGRLKPAYKEFGMLSNREFGVVRAWKEYKFKHCIECGKKEKVVYNSVNNGVVYGGETRFKVRRKEFRIKNITKLKDKFKESIVISEISKQLKEEREKQRGIESTKIVIAV